MVNCWGTTVWHKSVCFLRNDVTSPVAVKMASHVLAIIHCLLSSFVDLYRSQTGLELDLVTNTRVK